jgi:hypothetical protein
VALAAANGPGLIVAFLAVVASGAVPAPLKPALGEAELAGELDDLRVSRLLHDGVAAAMNVNADSNWAHCRGVVASLICVPLAMRLGGLFARRLDRVNHQATRVQINDAARLIPMLCSGN